MAATRFAAKVAGVLLLGLGLLLAIAWVLPGLAITIVLAILEGRR